MFTGLVEATAQVEQAAPQGPGARLVIAHSPIAAEARLGDSIAVNGCCLTVVEIGGGTLAFDLGPETLQRTNLGCIRAGDRVNLERSLAVGDRLGGHFVTGHVDGLGTLARRQDEGEWSMFWVSYPAALRGQLASKGSIALDGVSLTLVDVTPEQFSVMLIPHTLEQTTLGQWREGRTVNLETDVLAKYVQAAVAAGVAGPRTGNS
ncbi:MAG: riboflavin synthase [Planctomycetes bacterium]|nr:riboflavin synthase [Planctomycetota bacterium]